MPINDYFIFDGKKCTDYGLYMASDPQAIHPSRRGELFPIPGRNGSIVREDGSYDTFTQTYDVFFDSNTKAADVYGLARKVAAWLLGSRGFCRLEDSYEPEYFRLARCAEQMGVENRLARFGRSKIEFECQPQRYLKSGESAYNFKRTRITGGNLIAQNVQIKPIPYSVSAVQLDILTPREASPSPGLIRLSNSRNTAQYIQDDLHIVADPGDWKYTNVMEDSRAQFKAGLRYSFSSKAFVSNNDPACDCVVIPIPKDETIVEIRVRNASLSAYNTIYGGNSNSLFEENYGRYSINPVHTDKNGDATFAFGNNGSSYVTFNLAPVADPSKLIVTVNEKIEEINADGLIHYTGKLNVTEPYDTASMTVYSLADTTSKVTYTYEDGSTFGAVSFDSGTFRMYNPTEYEAMPLLRFSDVTPAPVAQTLTNVPDTYIDSQGEVVRAVWADQQGAYTTQPVSVSGAATAFVTASSYTFLDANGNSVGYGFYKSPWASDPGYFDNQRLVIPSGATHIVLCAAVGNPVALSVQAPTQNPGTAAATINGTTINLNFSERDTIYLDSDLHDAYYVDGSNANAAVTFVNHDVDYPTFPGLVPGENIISVGDGSVLDFEIIPRWWIL